jgi:hypothetical protein
VLFVDRTVPARKRTDADGRYLPDVVDDRFIAVQLTQHLDLFDRDRSDYDPDPLFPGSASIVRRLVLKEAPRLPPLFRLAVKTSYLFVSAEAKKRLEEERVQGVVFWSLDKVKA